MRMTVLMDEDFYRRLSAMVESMPAFPESVHQVMSMTADINCSPKDLVKVIESDPIMTMKILKLVNSAFFALSRNVASVQHALVYLGLNTVKNLAISIATVDSLPRQSIPELPMAAFLTHSLATASMAQHLEKIFCIFRMFQTTLLPAFSMTSARLCLYSLNQQLMPGS